MKWEDVLDIEAPADPVDMAGSLKWDDVLDLGDTPAPKSDRNDWLIPKDWRRKGEPEPEPSDSSWFSLPSPYNRPVSIGQPGTGMTPDREAAQADSISNLAEAKRRGEEADRQALLQSLRNPPLDDPTRLIQLQENLPYPISADVYGNQDMRRRYEEWNEMITGVPSLGRQYRLKELEQAVSDADKKDAEAKKKAKQELNSFQLELKEHMTKMAADAKAAEKAGMKPDEFMAQQEADALGAPIPLPLEVLGAAGEGLWTGTERTANAMLGRNSANREQALTDQWQEQVAKLRDKKSLLGYVPGGAWLRGATRQAGTAVGQMAPGMVAGAATGNPAVSYAMMGGQAGIDAFGQARSAGKDFGQSLEYGMFKGAIEAATEQVGGLERFVALGGEKTVGGLLAAAAGEGNEEILAEVLGNGLDVVTKMNPNAFSDSDYLETFTVGMLAGGMMGAPKYAAFMHDQDVKSAREAGISEDVVKTDEDAKRVAQKARDLAEQKIAEQMGPAEPVPHVATPTDPGQQPPAVRPGYESDVTVDPDRKMREQLGLPPLPTGDPQTQEEYDRQYGPQPAPPAITPETAPVAPPATPLPAESTTGLAEMGGQMGGAIADNFYAGIEKSLVERGRLPTPEQNTKLGKAWRALKGKVEPQVFVSALRAYQPDTPEQWQEFIARLQPQEPTNAEQVTGPARSDATSPSGGIEPSPTVGSPGVPPSGPGSQPVAEPAPAVPLATDAQSGEQTAEAPVERGTDQTAGPALIDKNRGYRILDYSGRKPHDSYDIVFQPTGRKTVKMRLTWGLFGSKPKESMGYPKIPIIQSEVLDPGTHRYMEPYEHTFAPTDENGNVVDDGFTPEQRAMDLGRIEQAMESQRQQIEQLKGSKYSSDHTKAQELADDLAEVEQWVAQRRKSLADEDARKTKPKTAATTQPVQPVAPQKQPANKSTTPPPLPTEPPPLPTKESKPTKAAKKSGRTREEIVANIREKAISPEVADANIALLENIAAKRGMSLEEYVNDRMNPIESEISSEEWDRKHPKKKKGAVVLEEEPLAEGAERFGSGVDQNIPSKRRGQISVNKRTGKSTITLFENAQDASTLFHELSHDYLAGLMLSENAQDQEDLRTIERELGVKDGVWTRENHEHWARANERYMFEGKFKSEAMRKVLSKFRDWFRQIYKKIKNSQIDVKISPALREVLDRLYMTPQEIAAMTAEREAAKVAAKEEKKRQSAMPAHHKRIAKLSEQLSEEDVQFLRSADEFTANSLIDYAEDEVARGEKNGFIKSLIDQLDTLIPPKERQALRQKLLRLGAHGNEDRSEVDLLVDSLTRFNDHLGRESGYQLVLAEADSLGNGDLNNGLRELLKMSNEEIGERHGKVDIGMAVSDAIEQYKASLEKATADVKARESDDDFKLDGTPEPAPHRAETFDNQQKGLQKKFLSGTDLDPDQQDLFDTEGVAGDWANVPDVVDEEDDSFDPEDFEDDDSFVGGSGGLTALPPIPLMTPKGQHQIIKELGEAIGTPIAFGGMGASPFGGFFRKIQAKLRAGRTGSGANLIVSRLANDIPVVTHEAGHRLDSMFRFWLHKPIESELMYLGDQNTPGSRSSMSKSKSKAYQRREGVGEFFRYWFTDPIYAAQVAPQTLAYVEQVLDANKDLADALRQIQKDVMVWRQSPAQARLRSHIVSGENQKRRLTYDRLIRELVDNLHHGRIITEHVKKSFPNLPPSQQTYMLARLLRGSYGLANTFLTVGQGKFKSKQVKPRTSLKHILAPVSNRLDEFTDWIVAVRAKELHAQGRETGLLDADVDETFNNYANDKQFHETFDKLKEWNDSILQYATDAGLVSAEAADSMRQMNQDYVPFHRMFEIAAGVKSSEANQGTGRGLNLGKPGSMMRMKGSTRPIVDPLETMVRNAYSVLTAAEKAAIHNTIKMLAESDDGGKFVRKIADPIKRTEFMFKDIREELENMGADVDMIDDFERLSVFTAANQAQPGRNIIRVMENGKFTFYQMLDNDLYDMFHALDVEQASAVIEMLSKPADVLRAGVTLNPGYVLANVIRDNVGAPVISKYGGATRITTLPFEPIVTGLVTMIGHRLGIDKYSKLYGEFMLSGADNSIEAAFFDREKTKQYLERTIAGGKSKLDAAAGLINPLAFLRMISNAAEETTRIGEYQITYRALRRKGMKKGEARRLAAYESRDRQDFAKGGATTKSLRRMFPFWNAALQGTVRFKQTFQQHPVRVTLQGIAWVSMPTLTLLAINWDDDDYWARPQWERDDYWLIPKGVDASGHTTFYKLPKPPLVGDIFGTTFERMAQSIREKDSSKISSWAKDFVGKQALSIVPTSGPVNTLYELSSPQGYSLFRRTDVVPDSLADLKPQDQWTDQTSEVAKKLGNVFGVSPMKIDYFIDQTTGGVGQAVKDASDQLYDYVTDQPQRKNSVRGTLSKRFITNDLSFNNEYNTKFYGYLQEMKQERASALRHGSDPGFKTVLLKDFEKMSLQIAGLRARARDESDKVKKAAMLEDSMQLAKNAVEIYEKNPSPPEAIQQYAFDRAAYAVRGLRYPEKKKDEAQVDYARRLADFQVRYDSADRWLRNRLDDPNVRAGIKEALRPKYFPDKGSHRYGERLKLRNEWMKLSREWD